MRARRAWASWSILLAHAAAVQAVGFAVRPAASYRALELGMPVAVLGVMSAAYAFAPLLLALPVGKAVDRFGERPMLVAGGFLLVVSSALMATLPDSIALLVAALALAGVAHLMCVVAEQTVVAGLADGPSDLAFGRYTFASSLGQAAGPMVIAVAGGSSAVPDLRPVLLIAGAISVIVLVLSPVIGSTTRAPGPDPSERGARHLLRDPRLRRAVLVSGIVMASVDITLVYLPALGQQADLSASLIGSVLAVRALASMAVRLTIGPLVRTIGRGAALVLGMLLAAVGLVVAAARPEPVPLMACAVLLGAGLGVCQPLTMALVADLAPPGQRGVAMTLRIIGNRLGLVIVPGAVGTVAAGAGAPAVLLATAVLLTGSAALSRSLR